jgi:tight adherence protein C
VARWYDFREPGGYLGNVGYLFFKLVLPAGLALGAALVFVGLGAFDLTPMARLLVCGGAAFLGFAGPDIFLKNQTTKRREAIRKALPDTLDLLVICAEAGLSLDAALKRSARELARSTPEIADELELTSIELGFLPERHQALENLNRRTNLPAVRSVVNALSQAERYGTPLAQSLRVLASEYRSERMLKAEEKASRLPATMTIPLIFFVLPPLFVVLLGPGLLRIIDGLSKL